MFCRRLCAFEFQDLVEDSEGRAAIRRNVDFEQVSGLIWYQMPMHFLVVLIPAPIETSVQRTLQHLREQNENS